MGTEELAVSEPPDLCLGGPLPLCFGRYYASLLDREGVAFGHLGTNWLGTFDWKLEVAGSTETIVDNRGERLLFGAIVGGGLVPLNHFEESNTLVIRAADNMHRLHRGQQRRTYEFDGTSGLLQRILDEHGNSLVCSYTGGLLTSVGDGHGRTLTFAYDPGNHLILAGDGARQVSYGYNGNLLTNYTDPDGHGSTYSYATGPYPGLLVSRTSPAGRTPMTYAYSAEGEVSSEMDALGHVWTFGVGPGGGCTVLTPTGDTWTAFHDAGQRLLSLHDPLGGITSWTYDAIGRPASLTSPRGGITTIAYDPASGFPSDLGRPDGTHMFVNYDPMPLDGFDVFHVAGISYPDGAGESFAYDAAGNLITQTDRAGQAWTRTYNAFGQLLSRTNPAGGVTTFAYDPLLRLASQTDNAGNTIAFTSDAFDRITRITHPDATHRDYAYDALGRLVTKIDELGKMWTCGRDADGLIASWTDPLLHSNTYACDAMGRLATATDPLGRSRTYAYDAVGRLVSETDRTGRTTVYAYDALGRPVTHTDPGGNASTFAYDADGRLLTATDPLGHAMTYEYDALDRVTLATDPLGTSRQFAYDAMDRVTSAIAPVGHTRTYGYDALGRMIGLADGFQSVAFGYQATGGLNSIRDPNNKIWPFVRDPQGRLTSRVDPLGRATNYSFDTRNRLAHAASVMGTADINYDAVSRRVLKTYSDGGSVAYSWDDASRLLGATGASFGYDEANRMTSCNGLTFTRDGEGRLTSETYAPGKTVTYSYDTRGLLSQVTDWVGGTTSFAHDPAGRLTGIMRPDGTMATYQYDAANNPSQLVETKPGPPTVPLATISLTRDALGRITSALRDVPLKPAPAAPESNGYAYDDASQIVGFNYDGLGRLVNDGTRSFQWNLGGRLAHYSAGADNPNATYDAFGRMLSRTQGSATRQFVWDYATGTPSLASTNPGPPNIFYFIHTPSGVPLHIIDASGARTFYHFDEAGNTMFLTNQGGSVVASYAYTPTGGTQGLGYTVDNPFTYAGALGVMKEGEGGLFRYGPTVIDGQSGRCLSCPSSPLGTMGAGPGLGQNPGPPNVPSNWSGGFAPPFDLSPPVPLPQFSLVGIKPGPPIDFVGKSPGPIQSPIDFVGKNPGPGQSPLDFVGRQPGPIQSPLDFVAIGSGPPISPIDFVGIKPGPPISPMDLVGVKPGPPISPIDFVGANPGPPSAPVDFVGLKPGPPSAPVDFVGLKPGPPQSLVDFVGQQPGPPTKPPTPNFALGARVHDNADVGDWGIYHQLLPELDDEVLVGF